MLCINLIHCCIDIFDINQWKPQDIIKLHTILKEKTDLIYEALCRATKWRQNKMPNITRFKLPLQPCTRQCHINDDTFYVWKNIELWNGDSWIRPIDEVTIMQTVLQCRNNKQPIITYYCHKRFYFMQNKGTTYRAELLHYLIFHPMNEKKDLPPCIVKFRLGGRKPKLNTGP
jgi:hypothetical protein